MFYCLLCRNVLLIVFIVLVVFAAGCTILSLGDNKDSYEVVYTNMCILFYMSTSYQQHTVQTHIIHKHLTFLKVLHVTYPTFKHKPWHRNAPIIFYSTRLCWQGIEDLWAWEVLKDSILYLRPDGSTSYSPYKGCDSSARIALPFPASLSSQSSVKLRCFSPTILLDILTILLSLFLSMTESEKK